MNKNIRIVYGLGREDIIFSRLKHSILGIERSKYKYSFFDFYQKSSNVLFELKSLGYAKTGFTYAIMNTRKLTEYNHLVFLFEYENDNIFGLENHLYYHIYDHKRKHNMRYIYPDETNRMIQEEVIDIPMNELIRFNYGIEASQQRILIHLMIL